MSDSEDKQAGLQGKKGRGDEVGQREEKMVSKKKKQTEDNRKWRKTRMCH